MVAMLRKGTDVVDAATGARLGRVHAVYLDPRRRRVAGLALRTGGVFWRRRPGLVPLASVRGVGPDAVAVAGRPAFGAAARDPAGAGLVALDALMRAPVRLEDGSALGRVAAVRFALEGGRLAGLEVEPDGLPLCRMLLGAEQVVRLGPGAVVVREPAAGAAPEPVGGPLAVAPGGPGQRVA